MRALQATFYKHHVDGAPMPANQHPLHYPHGTLFMAPGPAGQTAPLPNDPDLHELMLTEVENYISIHESYNFDYDPEPDSMFGQALQWEKEQMDIQNERLASKGLYRDAKGKMCGPALRAGSRGSGTHVARTWLYACGGHPGPGVRSNAERGQRTPVLVRACGSAY